jgi:hypothetical protein
MRTLSVLLTLGLAACAPKLYQRSTVVLDHADVDQFTVRYGELSGCLLRHQLPVDYTLKRPRYRLDLRPQPATGEAAPTIDIKLTASGDLQLRFPGVEPAPEARYAEGGQRYLLDTAGLGGSWSLQVVEGAETIGDERFSLSRDSCRVLGSG